MASTNGARKTPATSSQAATKGSLINPSVYDKFLTADDKKPIKIRLRAPLPKQTAPGNWLENKIEGALEKKKDGTSTSTSPLVNPIDAQIAVAFPSGKPFEDTPEIVQCKHCKKPVLKLAATAHVKDCLKKKQEKAQKKKEAKEAKDAALRKERNGGVSPDPSVDEESGKRGTVSARKTALDGDGGGKKVPGKKRKADDDDDVKGPSAKKKKKEEVKPKGGKPKGPVDVEKQCGVVLANGQQCARSLTCKSHSMGAKRAVPGRSLPYDVLLNQYQKKNQAKLQRAAIDANAPPADDFEAPGNVDSDEERDQIVAAINRSFRFNPLTGQRLGGRPIVTSQIVSTRQKYKHVRVKELLQHSLGGARGAGLFSTPATVGTSLPTGGGWLSSGGGGLDSVGHGMEVLDGSRRASLSHRGPVHGIPASRKPSISGQV